jgi:hypothetical protein
LPPVAGTAIENRPSASVRACASSCGLPAPAAHNVTVEPAIGAPAPSTCPAMSAANAGPASERLDTASANSVAPRHTEVVEGWLESIGRFLPQELWRRGAGYGMNLPSISRSIWRFAHGGTAATARSAHFLVHCRPRRFGCLRSARPTGCRAHLDHCHGDSRRSWRGPPSRRPPSGIRGGTYRRRDIGLLDVVHAAPPSDT